jgi:2-polyprenyl-6-methoxyphenol hydroxylase-like FAD-dependent oxidoreductase
VDNARVGVGDVDVLMVGAGPTGLVMAAELRYHGASARLIDARVDRAHESRALGVTEPRLQAREARAGRYRCGWHPVSVHADGLPS